MYNFSNRLNKVFAFDNIRLFKIIEIVEYSFIFLLLIVILMLFLNKYYFKYFNLKTEQDENDKKNVKIIKSFLNLFKDIVLIVIILFYLRKIALLFPSIPHLINPDFIPNTTLDYTIHIALVVVLMELLPGLQAKIVNLGKLLD